MYEIECPYCGKINEVSCEHLDFRDGETSYLECRECGKQFIAVTDVQITFDSHKADCLNDGEHKWKPTITAPRAFTRMRCECCGQEREPTEDERKQYEIPSRAEYLRELNRK